MSRYPVRHVVCCLLWVLGSMPVFAQYRELEWVELLPEDDYQALLSAPPVDHGGGDQPGPAQNGLRTRDEAAAVFGSRFEQALVSTAVRGELDGSQVRLPGFVVPLEYDANRNVTEFFLVPYFGACIHVPPPPPNQIIYVAYPEGLTLDSIQKPFWVSGLLTTAVTSNDTALSAYHIDAAAIAPYGD